MASAPIKLKLTNLKDGQESLLMVTKINVKGVLVQSPRVLPLKTPVRISLQLSDGLPNLDLNGEVYRVAEKPNGQRGMILRFLSINEIALKRIQKLSGPSLEEDDDSEGKTMVVPVESVRERPPLAKSPQSVRRGKRKGMHFSATVDEEEAQLHNLQFAEETRFIDDEEIKALYAQEKKTKWKRLFRLFIVFPIIVLGFSSLAIWVYPLFHRKLPILKKAKVIAPTPAPVLNQEPVEEEKKEPPPPAPVTKRTVSADLDSITVEDTPGFIKVLIDGPKIGSPEVTRTMRPKRLLLEWKGLKSFSTPGTKSVNVDPLLKIRVKKKSNSLQVSLDLFPSEFPRYDIKEREGGVTIYLHR